MKCHKNAHPDRNIRLFGRGAAVFCAAFILAFAGCESPDNTQNQQPAASDFDITGLGQRIFTGAAQSVVITPKDGKSSGSITIYYNDSGTAPYAIGSYTVTFNVSAASGWNEAKYMG